MTGSPCQLTRPGAAQQTQLSVLDCRLGGFLAQSRPDAGLAIPGRAPSPGTLQHGA